MSKQQYGHLEETKDFPAVEQGDYFGAVNTIKLASARDRIEYAILAHEQEIDRQKRLVAGCRVLLAMLPDVLNEAQESALHQVFSNGI